MHYIEKYQLLVTNENPEYKFVSYRRDKATDSTNLQ